MSKVVASGSLDAVNLSPKTNPKWKAKLYDLVVGGEAVSVYDTDNKVPNFPMGSQVEIREVEGYGGRKNNSIFPLGAPQQASAQSGGYQKKSYTPSAGRSNDQQASIVAQNAYNRGVEIVRIAMEAHAKCLQQDIKGKGVTQAGFAMYADPDYVAKLAKHYGELLMPKLLAGDLSTDFDKMDSTPEVVDEAA